MGPLVTSNIISENTNLLLAFVIGIGFGFVLENSGFSSSRKLAGMFYGYDTTVLKVFFTAAITAMLGTILFGLFGWLDLSVIYINPIYMWSSIIGGAIMGLGFITGGYCPGTAFCAVSIGKLDALAFIGGLFIGVLIFMEGYPLFEKLYMATFMGAPFVYDALGISRGLFALLLIVAAFGMFWVGEWSEKKFPREEY
jgi:uncharacterized protein